MITFKNVTVKYKNTHRPALQDVTFRVSKGELVFLIGPSGSGKSTLLSILLREVKPTEGQVIVSEVLLNKLSGRRIPYYRQTIGCIFQDFRLLQQKTVFENVAFALEVIGKPINYIKKMVPEALDLVGLSGRMHRMPYELSGGEQQRVAIARAFVNRPKILLADEPTGNLDPDTSEGIVQILEQINRIGTTVLMATHDNRIVDSLRRRVIELDNGKIIRDENRGVYGIES